MAFTLAWLDSSEHERRRALDVIELFDQPETVDELGLGTVRDTIADVLSPGTSTIQTRARYFFFIPWAYQELESRPLSRGAATAAARRREVDLIEALSQATDTAGVIGIESGATLQRLPSEVYWAGLGRLGVKIFRGSRGQYHRALERGLGAVVRDDVNDMLDGAFRVSWHPHLPAPPPEFPKGATLELTAAEAEFFCEQVKQHAQGSLLAFLVSRRKSVGEVDLPWVHPEIGAMSDELRRWLEDARCYSECMWGAQLLYNSLLAEKQGMTARLSDYATRFEQWRALIKTRRLPVSDWNRGTFWDRLRRQNPRLPLGVRRFSEAWIDLVVNDEEVVSSEDLRARALIANRERELKGSRARLFSQSHLDLWRGASSPEQLNYRWWITRRIVDDVVSGLKRS